MAARKKQVKTVTEESYTELEMYCIWLHEYYNALMRAGFKSDVAMTVMMDKGSYPEWIGYGKVSATDIEKYLDEEED